MISEKYAIINESDLLVLHLSACSDWQLVQNVIDHICNLKMFSDDEEEYEDDL